MHYTVRLTFKVNGSKRMLKTFVRSEFAIANTSSHATRFNTYEEADAEADKTVKSMEASGRVTFISADYFKVM